MSLFVSACANGTPLGLTEPIHSFTEPIHSLTEPIHSFICYWAAFVFLSVFRNYSVLDALKSSYLSKVDIWNPKNLLDDQLSK